MSWFTVRGLRLAYHRFGPQDAPAVLCFHGFLDHGMAFRPIAGRLSDTHAVYCLDFRGHGLSDWVGDGGYYHFLDVVADAYAWVEHLGLKSLSLVGHSMGGSVAMGLASLLGERVERVLLLEGMGPPREDADMAPLRLERWTRSLLEAPQVGSVAERRLSRRPMAGVEDAALRMRTINPRLGAEHARQLAEYGTEPGPGGEGVVWRFDPLHRAPPTRPFNIQEWLHHWAKVRAEVLSLYGADTIGFFGDLEERHGCVDRLRAGRVEDAGHNLHHDHPEKLAEIAARFFRGQGIEDVPGLSLLPRA